MDWRRELRTRLADEARLKQRDVGRARFSPKLSYGRHFGPPLSSARQAAVMVCLMPYSDGWAIPLTVRPHTIPDHPGQISFPGGRIEDGETAWQAACREFEEELGVTPFPGECLGELQRLYVYNSNFFVHPFVSVLAEAVAFQPCETEVARVLLLPVPSLIQADGTAWARFSRGRVCWQSPVIDCQQDQIWGATAIMLGEFASVLEGLQLPPPPGRRA